MRRVRTPLFIQTALHGRGFGHELFVGWFVYLKLMRLLSDRGQGIMILTDANGYFIYLNGYHGHYNTYL